MDFFDWRQPYGQEPQDGFYGPGQQDGYFTPGQQDGFYGPGGFGPGGPGGQGVPVGPGGTFGPGIPFGTGGAPGQGMPPGPPPAYTPQQPQIGLFAVDPGAIYGCRFRYTYIWPRYGRPFWAWITFVGRRSVAGFRWRRRRWVYFAMDLRDIQYFECSR